MALSGSNTLQDDFKCPECGQIVSSGIGFRAGVVNNLIYKTGDRISWEGTKTWPPERPEGGSFKTIGYFECENLKCETWHDCYPEVQEVLITLIADTIVSAKPIKYSPDKIEFAVFAPDQEIE